MGDAPGDVEQPKLMSLFALDLALRAGTVALLLVLSASLLRDFRNVVAGRLRRACAGLGRACRDLRNRRDHAGFGRACATDRAVDRQCRGALAVHARAVR